tara:strand:+ start:3970 stop:4545 length:576 start_codon:yes stop_codon:yes gene_type:complete
MVSLAKTWLVNENYWTLHPMVQEFGAFKKLYQKDKTKGKKESSKLMWGIAMLIDPHEDNKLRTQPHTTRIKIINEDWFDPGFNWDHPEIVGLIEAYKDFCLTISEKELVRYEKKLSQRGDFIDKTNYTLDSYDESSGKIIKGTAAQLDKMMVDSGKIFDELEKIKEKIGKEDIEGQLKGGALESAADKGEI